MVDVGMKNDLNVDQVRKLWILDLIIQSGSLKGAAARAKISPSAVSQSLTALEKMSASH
jgi:DNA-binding transcriptional LysR family regulator